MATPSPISKGSQQLSRSPNWLSSLGRPPVLSTIAASALVLGLRAVGALQGLELGIYDQMMRLRPTPPPDDRILVVGIDESDIQTRREWPIEDATISELLDILLASEPRAIGLDMFRDVPIGEGHEALLEQIQESEVIFPVCKVSSPDNPGVPPPAETPASRVSFSDLVVDPGGILRRSLLIAAPPEDSEAVNTHLCNTPEEQLFALNLQLALQYLDAEGIMPELTADQELQLGSTVLTRLKPNIGGYHNADAQGYQILLNYRAADDAVLQVSLTEVLEGRVDPDEIRDRIVLIGATTPEAKDEFYTPFSGGLDDSQKMAGVIVHAQSTSQILSAVLDGRPLLWSWPAAGEAGWIVLWALGGALFAWYVRRPLVYAAVAIALLAGLYAICYALFLMGGWVPLVPSALALGFASGGVVLLDRFNKSDYGQAVYRQMKSLLRLEIDIDKSRVGEQVAEITETDYFNKLQSQAKELREKRRKGISQDSAPDSAPKADVSPSGPARSSSADEAAGLDYFDSLKKRADQFKSSNQSAEDDSSQ